MSRPQLVRTRSAVIVILAAYTAIGVLLTLYRYLEAVSNRHNVSILPYAIDEMTGAYTALVAIPIAIWAARRFPISRQTWTTGIPVAIGGALVYTVIHTTLMWGTRLVLYPVTGLGAYDYGNMIFRYPMEGSNDLIIFAFVTGFVYGWKALETARQAELATAELHTKLAEAELENLRLQLNPHFLFNTLNAISAVMYEDVRKADEMIAKLSDFLRLVLESDGVHEVPLDEEVEVERKYVDIMTARLEQRLDLRVRVGDDVRSALVPFMILQPLLENSIRHGVPSGRGAIEISVEATRRNGSTVIAVSDDGVGYAPAGEPGRGLSIVRSRLAHMYGEGAGLTIERRTPGTLAVVTLPFSGRAS